MRANYLARLPNAVAKFCSANNSLIGRKIIPPSKANRSHYAEPLQAKLRT